MKVELHLHTSRYSFCADATPFDLMAALIEAGYEAVYITEHDAVWAEWEIDDLRKRFPAIRIFSGVEITISDDPMEHLLVLGTTDPDYLMLDGAEEILAKARDEGHLTILAHPFRWPGADGMLQEGLLPDAIEYLTCNQGHRHAHKALDVAAKLDLPLVNGGDVHALDFIDRYWIETASPLHQADGIREIVRGGAYINKRRD